MSMTHLTSADKAVAMIWLTNSMIQHRYAYELSGSRESNVPMSSCIAAICTKPKMRPAVSINQPVWVRQVSCHILMCALTFENNPFEGPVHGHEHSPFRDLAAFRGTVEQHAWCETLHPDDVLEERDISRFELLHLCRTHGDPCVLMAQPSSKLPPHLYVMTRLT